MAPNVDSSGAVQSVVSDEELAVLMGWDESLVPGLEEWIFEHEEIEQQMLIQVLLQNRVARLGPDAVWAWASGAADSRSVMLSAATAIAERDPEEAVRLASPAILDGSQPELVPRIAVRWSRREPRAAFDWLQTTPAGPARRDAITEAARYWITNDRTGFYAYMDAHRDELPEWLEPAFGLYGRALGRDDRSDEGLELVSRLRDERLRSYNQTLILRFWLARDPESARRWAEEHEVPEPILKRAGFRRQVSSSGP
jgi:hypothetical protein